MLLLGNAWPTFLVYCLIAKVNAQASVTNPFIWQTIVQYDLTESNKTKLYIPETSAKVYSQDFQTVFKNKDEFGHNERLVLNLGDACNGTTIENVDEMNGNLARSPSMMSQPSIGLVQRGGRCLKWSEKIANVQALSSTYQLQLTGIVIYDNVLYNDTSFIQEDTNDASYPSWPVKAIPDDRNINSMTDENVIDKGSTFLAVYFVPRSYMDFLNKTLIQNSFQGNNTKMNYTQLTFSLNENHFVTMSNPGTSGKPSTNDDSSDSIGNLDTDRRNYIIYAVVAASVVMIIYMLIRWFRAMRRSNTDDVEQNGGQNMLMTDVSSEENHVIPFLDLANICPILSYEEAFMTNTNCAICLDDFQDDFYVRVLPCQHGYCTACIDVWLTKKSSFCPICKYDCRLALFKGTEELVAGTPAEHLDPPIAHTV